MDEPKRTLNKRGRRSREEILEVAARLMAERGYAATTLSALAIETHLPKSAIYHHFESKAGLLSAVMAHGAYDFFNALNAIESTVPADGSVRDKLGFALHQIADIFSSRSDFLRLHFVLLMSTEAAESPLIEDELLRVRIDGRQPLIRMLQRAYAEYGDEAAARAANELVHFAMAGFDGAFIGARAEPERTISERLDVLADALDGLGKKYA
ncbi:MAG: helix-turn-helix domain-containing protein [Propionibacteriaceae bacterium]|nr:helix-turn-helix domain-containing protein [Propionibacteriaceae bacterium]